MSSEIDPDEHEHRIGAVETYDLGRITRRDVRRYARAVEDDNPLFTDLEYALEHGYDDLVVPPNYLSAIIERGAGRPSDRLREDGIDPQRFPFELPPTAVLMGGGQELTIDRYAVAGEEITAEETFLDIYQRESDSMGTLTFLERETEYFESEGDRVLHTTSTTIVGDRQ